MMVSVLARLVVAIGGSMAASMLLKATVVLGLALVTTRLVPRARASVRHVMLAAAFSVLLMLPMIAVVLPAVVVEIPMTDSSSDWMAPAASLGSAPVAEPLPENGGPVPPTANRRPSMSISMSAAFRSAWTAGVLLFLIPFIVSFVDIRRIRRNGVAWPAGEPIVRTLATQAGVRRQVRILLHDHLVAPMTCGLLRPAIVLPSNAAEWTAADVRQAVVHELEHVRRADWPIHLMARAVCAFYWFHPFVWMAWRHLCLESERACDDAVLGGADETAYAEQLVSLARRFVKPASRHALSMAGQSDLSVRIAAVLDHTQVRGRVGIVRAATIAGVAVVLVLAIAPLKAIARSSDARARFLTSRTAAIGVDVPLLRTPAPIASPPKLDEPSRTSTRVRPASTPSAQPQVTEATSPAFEVVSVTPKPSGQTDHKGPVLSGDELTAINTQLRWLIFEAYGIGQYQLSGGPEWIGSDYFDVTAKAHAPASREELRSMLRTLLADRFHLVVHTEKRDTPIYILVVAAPDGTLGPNLHRGTADCATLRAAAGAGLEQTGIPCGMNLQIGRFAGRGFGLNVLAGWLSRDARRMIVDKTGLDGVFDFDLTYTPEQLRHHSPDRFPTVDPEGPSIFTAVEEQLGLKLEPQDSLGDVLVIDHVEQPTRD